MNNKRNPKKLALNISKKQGSFTRHKTDDYQTGPACILPNLYLGAYHNALDTAQLERHRINCIINVACEITIKTIPHHITYHHFAWTHSQQDLAKSEFTRAISLIYQAHSQHQTVLIHCQQGIERSAALVVAFLIHLSSSARVWSLDDTLRFVKTKAPGIRPNMELIYQLREYERSLTVKTRPRRSESVSDFNNVQLKKRQRSISCRDEWSMSQSSSENKKQHVTIDTNKKKALAITSTLVILAAIYYQKKHNDSSLNYLFNIEKPVYPIF
ncbi:protein-tyrosine phosphatase-like protein [Gilbertella persicaria]|uniref:protein-tyrosine phosphatase-like protein n=1 Tax=Gilbertella persicaria TaxID=101096 RepID=UPI00221EF723|nr:protein-tyrosine phosphatase-like protein [Gilbertella persicaria]KAI8047558.1 protein-tyrosine phosphatase-like protein [Gilbertella persicaria]